MVKQAVDIIFPQNLIREPIICQMAKKFDVVFNLRRAKVTDTIGEIALELEGDPATLEKSLKWLDSIGVKVNPITKDTLES